MLWMDKLSELYTEMGTDEDSYNKKNCIIKETD